MRHSSDADTRGRGDAERGAGGWVSASRRLPLAASRAHETRVRVRYADTDAMGVVYYANYLAYFEAARVEFLRAMGVSYRALEEQGMAAPVVEASCRYRAPARFDDQLVIRTRLAELKRVSFAFEYEIVREPDQVTIAQGRTHHACVNLATLRPVPIPAPVLTALRLARE